MTAASERTSGLWINPAVGVAGDMLLAALLDAGADLDVVRRLVGSVGLPEWSLDVERTTRRGVAAAAVSVTAPTHDHHRSWSTIDGLLETADLPDAVRDGARRTFRRLAEAEAEVHAIDIDDVHFHEVGAVDSIVDVVAVWSAWSDLGSPAVTSAPVGLGTGTTTMAHGTMAVPAPATLELLRGHPTAPVEVSGETATPTGVALLTTLTGGWGPLPAGTITTVGRGAGSWDPPGHPNVVTVVGFRPGADPAGRIGAEPGSTSVDAVLIETTVDDVSPEVLGHVLDSARSAGADDAWIVPVTMRKSRPGHEIRVLCQPDLAPTLRHMIAAETGTLGMREQVVTKHVLVRRTDEVVVDGHVVRIKVGPFGTKPEHDDVLRAANALDRPVRDVAREALARHRPVGS